MASNTKNRFKKKEKNQLRTKSKQDLLNDLESLKKELHQLRVAQVSGGAPAKLAQIRTVRKNIATILTIVHQTTKQKVREEYKKQGKKYLPFDLRPKLTRRERLRLPKHLRFKKTVRQQKLIKKYPQRKFAVVNLAKILPKRIRHTNLIHALTGKKPTNTYSVEIRKSRKLINKIKGKDKLKSKSKSKSKSNNKGKNKDKKNKGKDNKNKDNKKNQQPSDQSQPQTQTS